MFFVDEEFKGFLEVKRSKFHSYLTSYKNFNSTYKKLKELHPKATHIVYAFRVLNEFNQIEEILNDDNEPKRSAANPAMNALRGADLINSGVFVVRYFGGIKLGIGGLVKAYTDATNSAIKNSKLLKFEIKKSLKILIDFSNYSKFEYFFKKNNISFKSEFKLSGVESDIFVNDLELEEFLSFNSNNLAKILN